MESIIEIETYIHNKYKWYHSDVVYIKVNSYNLYYKL